MDQGLVVDTPDARLCVLHGSNQFRQVLTKGTQGYAPTHENIDLLRLRSFTLGRKLSDDEVTGPRGLDRLAELVSCMVPWVS